MSKTKDSKVALSAERIRQPLDVMVVQRLDKNHGPGPIRIFKTVRREETLGVMKKTVAVKVPLDHQLAAGTGSLSADDRRTFSDQGLTERQIAHVASKLASKKLASDEHRAMFDASQEQRRLESSRSRLVALVVQDAKLAGEVAPALSAALAKIGINFAPAAPPATTLSDKVSCLLKLIVEVSRHMESYKKGAKLGTSYDQKKLHGMLNQSATQDWKLAWFAFGQMVEQAKLTPFARPKGWSSNPELASLAAAHGFKSSGSPA